MPQPTPDLSRPLPVDFFDKVPSEILGLIASSENADVQTSMTLCRLSKRSNLACSHSLYGHDIVLRTLEGFNSFCETLSGEKFVGLVKVVKSLSVRGGETMEELDVKRGKHEIPDEDQLMERLLHVLGACTNLHTLSLVSPPDEAWDNFKTLFDGLEYQRPGQGLSFPRLRHLELQFTLNLDVLHFLKSHCFQLHSLSIHNVDNTFDVEVDIMEDVYHISGAFDLVESEDWDGKLHVKPLPLSPVLTVLDCSPFLASFLVPNSFVDSVRLKWPGAEEEDNRTIDEEVVQALKTSRAPHGVRTLCYTSDSWNLMLVAKAAERLPNLELLCIENEKDDAGEHAYGGDLTFGDGDGFTDRIIAITGHFLNQFNNLKVMVLSAPDFPGGTYQTFYQEFKLVQDWAGNCPSLLYAVLPHCKTIVSLATPKILVIDVYVHRASEIVWIRDPKYPFFVPDTLIQRYRPEPKSRVQGTGETSDPFCPPEYTEKFVHKLLKLEGEVFHLRYLDHFNQLQRPACPVKDIVETLLEKAGLLEELRSGEGPERRRFSGEDDDGLEEEYDRQRLATSKDDDFVTLLTRILSH